MDVEDEPNSYLKYFNDSDTPNAYLLENNEVEMFSVEPIFDMGAADWPQEGFPLLFTNSLIAKDGNLIDDQLTSSASEDLTRLAEGFGDSTKENQCIIATDLEPNQSEFILPLVTDELPAEDYKEPAPEGKELHQNYILINPSQTQHLTKTIQLINDNSILASINLPAAPKLNKFKSVNDMFTPVMANKCKICSYLCENLEQIKKHINVKHPELIFAQNGLSNGASLLLSKNQNSQSKELTVYVCSECRHVCTNKTDLKNHMIQAHGLATEAELAKQNEAKAEEKTPKKMSAYLDDVNVSLVKKQERALQKVKCSVKGCHTGFPSEELRRKHEELHVGDAKSMFKCSQCDKTFTLWVVARSHMHNEHGMDFGMIICPMCSVFKSYKTVRMLRHMMIHSEAKPFLCSDCGKSFNQLAQLKNHEIVHRLPEDMPTWAKVKKCDKCGRFFANSKSLKAHVKTIHENIRPFICNICGHKSSRKALLDLHIRQHTASKPHKCQYCEFRTGDPNSLRKHVMKHVGAVGYQCPFCPYSCIQAGSIKSHFLRRHKDKPGVYRCKHCSYSSINEACLMAHEKLHEAAKDKSSDDVELAERELDSQTDEETQSCFLNSESHMEETVDNGGITIPAGLEMPLV